MDTSPAQLFKLAVLAHTGLSRDAIHLYVGLAVFFGAALLFRRPIRSLVPWACVLLVACGIEAVDAFDDVRAYGHWRTGASVHDVVNTMVWPTVMLLLARWTRLFGDGRPRPGA